IPYVQPVSPASQGSLLGVRVVKSNTCPRAAISSTIRSPSVVFPTLRSRYQPYLPSLTEGLCQVMGVSLSILMFCDTVGRFGLSAFQVLAVCVVKVCACRLPLFRVGVVEATSSSLVCLSQTP